jgi:hypothetical protein
MSTGILGARTLLAGTAQNIYVNNNNDAAVISINVCNFNYITTRISIALSTIGHSGVTANEWIEFDAELLGKGVLERSGVVVGAGQYIVVRSTETNVSAQVWGVETGVETTALTISTNTVGIGPIWTTVSPLPTVWAGVSTSIQLNTLISQTETVSYSVTSGALPAGLSLASATGIISGTPTSTAYGSGVYSNSFTVTATDNLGNTSAKAFTLAVNVISGGTVTQSGGYQYHTFTSSSTLTITAGTGKVEMFAWGGGGGGGTVGGWGYGSPGGGGGAAYGKFTLTPGSYPVVVGGPGLVNGTTRAEGGGGPVIGGGDNRYASAGGGYTGLFLSSVSQANAILIAGGGGGGGSSRAGPGNSGGAGGGFNGQDGQSTYDGKEAFRGQGGTQLAAGGVISNSSDQQGALLGGRSTAGSGYGGAGGGGYWGGSAGGYSESNTMSGGGGGSGFFNSNYISDVVLYTGDRTTPGFDNSPLRGTYGQGGFVATAGTQGVFIVRYPI